MKNTIHKYKILYVLFFVLSLNFFSVAKGADTFNYSAFMPTSPVNVASYYNPNDFKGQPFPSLADDAPCVDLNYDLKIGSRDYSVYGSVTKLQMFLYSNEYMIYPPTGLFKYYTYNGVRNFQRDNGLKETGVVDRNTRAILKKISCSNQNVVVTPIQTSNPTITPIITPTITPAETSVDNNFTIEYSPNGADSGSPSTYSQSVIQGGTLTTATQGTMVKNGYTFTGWSTSQTGSDLIQAGSRYTPVTDLTLYAVWVNNNKTPSNSVNTKQDNHIKIIKDIVDRVIVESDYPVASTVSVTVYYDTYDPSTNNSCQTGNTKTLTINQNQQDSSDFINGNSNGYLCSIRNLYIVSINPDSDTTYNYISDNSQNSSPVAAPVTTNPSTNSSSVNTYYNINFDLNGGVIYSGSSPSTLHVLAGSSVTIPNPVICKTYKSICIQMYKGWSFNKDSGNVDVYPGTSYTPSGDTLLFATW